MRRVRGVADPVTGQVPPWPELSRRLGMTLADVLRLSHAVYRKKMWPYSFDISEYRKLTVSHARRVKQRAANRKCRAKKEAAVVRPAHCDDATAADRIRAVYEARAQAIADRRPFGVKEIRKILENA